MKIGIDLSALQTAHRMRGIGQTIKNLINNMPEHIKKRHQFVFYLQEDSAQEVLNELDVSNIDYSVKYILPVNTLKRRFKGRLGVLSTGLNQLFHLFSYYFGDRRIPNTDNEDIFLQCDQSMPLPRRGHQKNIVIAYDIIPYILSQDYLWSYSITRRYGYSRKYSLRQAIKRWIYIKKLRISVTRAHHVFTISEQTKSDFIEHVHVPEKKISTVHLGIHNRHVADNQNQSFIRFLEGSWGFEKQSYKFDPRNPFLLFIGGVDRRRRIEDLVTAFNHLRARGQNINLVLAGDSMRGPSEIDNLTARSALESSSYKDDIVYLGFVTDAQREWLYDHALAYVYPSVYEGFGLPVIEAMSHGTPVICYPSTAVKEVAKSIPLYAKSWQDITENTLRLIDNPPTDDMSKKSKETAALYSWEKTTSKIISSAQKLI